MNDDLKKKKTGQSSFTLIETIIALGLMVVFILEFTAVQGRAISFSTFERKVTQATWLAKAVMAHIEYKADYFELKEIIASVKDEKLPPELCPENPLLDCDFKYTLTIENWKLPIIELIAASLGDPNLAGIIQQQMKQALGDELLKVAHVNVSWAEGVRKDWVDVVYLIATQKKLNESIEMLKPVTPAAKDDKTDKKNKDQKDEKQQQQGPPPP